jgi:hypothetical protein
VKIGFRRLTKRDFFAIIITNVMFKHLKKGDDFCKLYNIIPGANSEVELKLIINGVEVDFQHFVDELEYQHNTLMKENVKRYQGEMIRFLLDHFNKIMKQAEDSINREIEFNFSDRKV